MRRPFHVTILKMGLYGSPALLGTVLEIHSTLTSANRIIRNSLGISKGTSTDEGVSFSRLQTGNTSVDTLVMKNQELVSQQQKSIFYFVQSQLLKLLQETCITAVVQYHIYSQCCVFCYMGHLVFRIFFFFLCVCLCISARACTHVPSSTHGAITDYSQVVTISF